MNTEAAGMFPQTAKPTAAERMRAFRERRRRGVRMIQVRIKEEEIEALERLGNLAPGQREDAGSIQRAVELLVSDTKLM
jgi:hypothetical protein